MSFSHLGSRSFYRSIQPEIDGVRPKLAHFNIKNAKIDPVAVLGVLMKNYAFANRTMVSGIERTPWMADPNNIDSRIALPAHGHQRLSTDEIAIKFKKRLENEALAFVKGKNIIGILLSGGMDSRIVAGIIKELQRSEKYVGDVVALTWGLEESRDVIYAKRIAKQFGWPIEHFFLSPELLERNIFLAADRGAEYSPVHLHAMSEIGKLTGLDGVLAGSYGDSIGRGEYSGRKIDGLPDILDKNLNQFAFMRCHAEKLAFEKIKADLAEERLRFPGRTEVSYREMEMQLHYMRRQLNACMEVIDDEIPLYQMFGDPEVFGFMWSLDPSCRTDDNYEALLALLPGDLLSIPWARTGKRYNQPTTKVQDDFLSRNNNYGRWLRTDLRRMIVDEISCGALQELGIFNNNSLEMWCKRWPKSRTPKADRLDEKMAWLASLSIFVKKNQIKGFDKRYNHGIADEINRFKALSYFQIYHLFKRLLKR
ncbi:asparagine synthase-related protein [Idiomarina xiamenensis]|uniref:Asparagine synthetase domain-containing protein n=1 Tax=Idiomarina xiamenensis 10-D-4 TaxID=740709 RepID=K2KS93_9GAMM|nr:asparagine synthase-related protein [Idiomarina xiamenensis]EKE85199.1 hypothetical protein A10D4_02605 [Idiomarina xiamenensis 10-D-4]